MYSETMFNFAAAANKLDLTMEEIFDILDLTVEDAELENLSVSEILRAVEDCEYYADDWIHGGDSCSHYCDA